MLAALLNELSVRPQRHHSGPRRLPPRRGARRSTTRHGVPARAPAAPGAPGASAPGPIPRCRWPGCGRAASWSRSAPPTCASPPRRLRPTSTASMGSALTAGDVAALEARTEGWIAALQLAALSMQGRDDAGAFIAGFAGDDRYIVDYLAEEVLDRQPADVRDFLLETSVLDRLTGPLCDAVTGRGRRPGDARRRSSGRTCSSSRSTTAAAGTATTTCSPTSCAPTCSTSGPARSPELHRRASALVRAARRRRPQAIEHALAGGDFARAADLIELAIPAMRRERREAGVRALGGAAARRRGARTARCSASASSARCMCRATTFDGCRPTAAATSSGWLGRTATGGRWSSSTRTSSPAPGADRDVPGRARPGRRRPRRHRSRHAEQALAWPRRTTTSPSPPPPRCRPRLWTRGDLDAAHDGVHRVASRACAGRARRRRPGLRDHPRRHRETQGRLGDGRAHLRARARARAADPGDRRCGARPTCTSG